MVSFCNRYSVETNADDHKSLVRRIRIFTTQGHPEFHSSIMSKMIEYRAASGVLTPEVAASARTRNELEVNNPGLIMVREGHKWDVNSGKNSAGEEKTWVNDGLEVGELIWEMLGM